MAVGSLLPPGDPGIEFRSSSLHGEHFYTEHLADPGLELLNLVSTSGRRGPTATA